MSLIRRLAVGVVLAGVAALAAPLVLPAAGRFLVTEDPAEPADAIVVLAGSYPDRILEAVELYKQGLAPRIMICREPDIGAFRRLTELGLEVPRPSDVNRMIAEQLGVPPSAIELFERGGNSTYREAQAVLDEILRRRYRAILLVTSQYHTRRAAAIYRLLAGDQVKIIVRPARPDDLQGERWWQDRISARRVVIEYQKWLHFHLLDRWGLSPVATPASTPMAAG
jgi:uncharacterized SAM-binding protein YcdF (DUF218 family)